MIASILYDFQTISEKRLHSKDESHVVRNPLNHGCTTTFEMLYINILLNMAYSKTLLNGQTPLSCGHLQYNGWLPQS